jgi:hypothetical protein
VILPGLFETLEACARLMNRTDIVLNDDWRRRGGTDHLREPAEVGRVPISPAHLPDSRSQPQGVQTALDIVEIAEGIFTRPGEIAPGFSCDCGHIDGGAIP